MDKIFIPHLGKNKKILSLLILPLICSAAVLRKEKTLKDFLLSARANNINSKKIYEALLQTYLFAGFPSALISLKTASEIFKFDRIKFRDSDSYKKIGIINCKKIYGKKFGKLINNVEEFSPELSEWLISEGYGKVLSRKGLSLKEREMCIVAVLCSLKFEHQLYSHINGAYRLENSREQIKELILSLEQVGGKSVTNFGMKVFNSYFQSKNNITS